MACNDDTTEAETSTTLSAEKQLRNAIVQHPDSLLLKEELIQYFRDNSNYDMAIGETNNALKKDSANARLWDIKATLYFEKGDTINAINAFEKAIALNPQPLYKISLGLIYAQIKNARALDIADALLKDPNAKAEKQAQFIKGLYFSYLGDYPKSISFFNTCLAIDYTYIDAYKEKAICLYHLTKYDEAIESLKKAVALQTTYDEGYYWLGRCYQKMKNSKEAIENYKTALQIDPDYAEAKDALSQLR